MIRLVVLAVLLVLPVVALYRRQPDVRLIGAYVLFINALTYWIYAIDKRRAQAGEWRISERALHLAELLGGWPGALMAQRRLRHKCSKFSFQFEFWLIVMAYQFAAYDSLQNWQFSRAVWLYIGRPSHGASDTGVNTPKVFFDASTSLVSSHQRSSA